MWKRLARKGESGMKISAAAVILPAVLVIAAFAPSARAEWTEGGIELCNGPAGQSSQQIISDGAGGAIVVWQDQREGTYIWDVYAQRLDGEGNLLWDAGGVNVSQLGGSQWHPVLVSDGAGGAIIAYLNDRTADLSIVAQRIRPNGTLAWPAGGIMLCGASYGRDLPVITSDGTGGAIVAWQDYRSGTNWDIYAARIDSTGNMPWTYNGVPVCTAGDDQRNVLITPDGGSGAIMCWRDRRNGNDDIYAQMINFLGDQVWANNGIVVENVAEDPYPYGIIPDMDGGAIIAWECGPYDNRDIEAERVLADGTRAWNPGSGITVCGATDVQSAPYLVSDGAGGAIFVWNDYRAGNWDIYAHHMDFAGGTTWPAD